MLLRFRFSNFKSFRDAQELSLVAAEPGGVARKVRGFEHHVLPVAAIYGANASGKSNVLKALQFMKTAVVDSHRLWKPDGPVPRSPFALDPAFRTEPSEFSVDILVGGKRFQYGFLVDDVKISKEWLHAFPGGKKQPWFTRSGRRITFGRMLRGPNRQIAALVRPNSLLLSVAAQNGHVPLSQVYRYFSESLHALSEDRRIALDLAKRVSNDAVFRMNLSEALRLADMGVSAVEAKQTEELNLIPMDEADSIEKFTTMFEISGVKLNVLHHGIRQTVGMDVADESNGTKAFLVLVDRILDSLTHGATICIDELDASLHSLLATSLVHRFLSGESNLKGAQLIFATHETNLLSSNLLRRDQIWFTEKDKNGVSHLYPLSDFKEQPNEDMETGYLQGRYGAIPFINSNAFLTAIAKTNGKK